MRYEDMDAGIYLRKMTDEDTERIVAWRNRDDVRKNFIYQELFTRESHENWVRTRVETGQVVQMIICNLSDDHPLGSVYIRDIDNTHHKAEYGIFIGEPEARGRGVGTAVAKLMLQYCFTEADLHRVYLRALSDNTQAIRSYEKAVVSPGIEEFYRTFIFAYPRYEVCLVEQYLVRFGPFALFKSTVDRNVGFCDIRNYDITGRNIVVRISRKSRRCDHSRNHYDSYDR